jgi:hypothetical protein
MGLRFTRRVRSLPGLRLNLSKSDASRLLPKAEGRLASSASRPAAPIVTERRAPSINQYP